MTNRSDRDLLNLNDFSGLKPAGGMRCRSADFIGAGRGKTAATRPDIELQPILSEAHKNTLANGRRPYRNHDRLDIV
jgi:hypothetical protein